MKKEVVKTGGDSIGIRFNKEERKVNNIELGDIIDISDMVIIKQTDTNISNIMSKQRQKDTINKIRGIIGNDNGFIE